MGKVLDYLVADSFGSRLASTAIACAGVGLLVVGFMEGVLPALGWLTAQLYPAFWSDFFAIAFVLGAIRLVWVILGRL
jgi:hypothetical protein